MPEPAQFAALFFKRGVQTTVFIAVMALIYTEGATAYLNTQKAFESKAVATNAWLRQQAEGVLAEQKARSELQVARNAAERQKAEADRAEAEAQKAESEAITARQIAANASIKAKADAETMTAEAELRKQKLIVAIETARNAAKLQAAEADKIEARVEIKRMGNEVLKGQVELTDCSKPFHSQNFVTDFDAIMTRRLSCGE